MSAVVPLSAGYDDATTLPALVDRAAGMLANARTAAEVLEAREMAGVIYDLAKRHARIARAKNAHDDLIAAAHRAQGHALEIEARAKYRLADEYDAAQERGDVAGHGRTSDVQLGNVTPPTAADLGLSRKDIHESRIIRDAERNEPGFVKQTVDEMVEAGQPPLRSLLMARARGKRRMRTNRTEIREQTEEEFEQSFGDSEASSAITRTAALLWTRLLYPSQAILPHLKEAMKRASEDDKQSIVIAHRYLTELVGMLPSSEVEYLLTATDELERSRK